MHGRLKVKTTAEQQEAKKKEREKKLQLYKATTARIFEKRDNGEFDKEMLTLTGELLGVNPDFYTLWNIRRQLMESWSLSKSQDEMAKVYSDELHFLEQCLRVNPKSYGTWHQRGWITDRLDNAAVWARELSLCSTYLEYDERNFHCWDYRRFVVQRAGVKSTDELQFTTDKISSNFSNFSSWHYRSRLLPLIYADSSHPTGVQEKALLNEFDLVQNAFFTDPNDQSAWFYHRWLLGQGLRHLSISDIYISKSEQRVMVALTRSAQLATDFRLDLCIGSSLIEADWKPASGCSHSVLWVAELPQLDKDAGDSFTVSLKLFGKEQQENTDSNSETSFVLDDSGNFWKNAQKSNFSHELSLATSETLNTELESCRQLHELEPDNKWVLLTMLSLMRALDLVKHQEEMMSYFDKLLSIDQMRSNYYADLRSRILMEISIETQPRDSRSFVLSNLGLTVMCHLEHLFIATSVDLSHNLLRDLGSVYYLQSVRQLNLGNNLLRNCRGLERLPALETVDVRNNDIQQLIDIEPLLSCPRLQTAIVIGNPVVLLLGTTESFRATFVVITES